MATDKIVLFPKWKEVLENESLQALKAKRYDEALGKLDELIQYHVDHQEILVGKMICLMELGRHEEAEVFAESLLHRADDGYFHYMHIYLTILFQTNQYSHLMETVEREIKRSDIPLVMKEQFQQLYAISQNMQRDLLDQESNELAKDLMIAFENNEHARQWNIVQSLHKAGVQPLQRILDFLVDEKVHPMTKTAILLWLQDSRVDITYKVHKFNVELEFTNKTIPDLANNPFEKEILFMVRNLEQQNPSMYHMIEEILKQYLYVRYPLDIPREDAYIVSEALQIMARLSLLQDDVDIIDTRVQKYIDEIEACQALYLTIVDA